MPFLNGPGSRSIQIHIVQLYRTRDVPSVNRETRGVLFRWVRSLTASRVYEKESCHTPQPRPSLQNSTRLGYNEHAGWQLLYILRKEDEKMAEGFRAMMAYDGEASTIQAYLARPALEEPRPAVIVIHEIVGLTDHIKDVANRFAEQGYVAFAPNLFSRPGLAEVLTPSNIGEVMQFMATVSWGKFSDSAYVQQAISQLPRSRKARRPRSD